MDLWRPARDQASTNDFTSNLYGPPQCFKYTLKKNKCTGNGSLLSRYSHKDHSLMSVTMPSLRSTGMLKNCLAILYWSVAVFGYELAIAHVDCWGKPGVPSRRDIPKIRYFSLAHRHILLPLESMGHCNSRHIHHCF